MKASTEKGIMIRLALQESIEPITIPPYIVAASALLRLAQPLFYAIEFGPDSPANFQRDVSLWRCLRGFSRALLERGALELSLAEACELREALRYCRPGENVDFLRSLEFSERG
jgi:hypothetical protein